MHSKIKKRKEGTHNDYFEQDASLNTQDWPIRRKEARMIFELTRTKTESVCEKLSITWNAIAKIIDSVVI